jgi:phenylacetate-CoA ligase
MLASVSALFAFATLLRNQHTSLDSLQKLQKKKLRQLLQHAYANVPFYQKRMKVSGISPEDITGPDSLSGFPMTFRHEIQAESLEEKLSRTVDPQTCKIFVTSGTTGIPLETYFAPVDTRLKNLGWIRVYWNTGMRPWQRTVAFIGQKQIKSKRSWYEYLGLWSRREISTWLASSTWLDNLIRWKPHSLQGNAMTLKILAEEMQKTARFELKPKFLFHSSVILDQRSRDDLENAFDCAVTDIYGSDEAGCIAWECKTCQGYHLNQDMLIVEVLKNGQPASPGESGEVVITNLHSYAMPFIRYPQGDVVTLSTKKPVCGCVFPLIERIEGRTDDFIVLEDGRKISPHPVYHSIDPIPGIRKWRLIQEEIRGLKLEIEPAPDYSPDSETAIRENLQELFKLSVDLKVIINDKISVEPGRKFRSVSSKVASETKDKNFTAQNS